MLGLVTRRIGGVINRASSLFLIASLISLKCNHRKVRRGGFLLLASDSISALCIIFGLGIRERVVDRLRGLTGLEEFHGLPSIESAASARLLLGVMFFCLLTPRFLQILASRSLVEFPLWRSPSFS